MSFDRVKAAGWAALETLTSTQMNVLDGNLALATDSRLVPDYIGAINFLPTFGSDCRQGVYDATTDKWVYIGGPDGTPVSFTSQDNYRFASGGAVANTGTWGVRDMAVNPSGVIVAVGAVTTSTSKIRQSSDGGATWNTRTAGAADSNSLVSVVWHTGSSLFVAVGNGGLIVTSPDGITWTTRAAPGGWGTLNIGCVASNGSMLIATQQDTGTADNDYLRTTNATDWSGAYNTFSTTTKAAGVLWSSVSSQWVLPGIPSKRSPDGSTWTDAGSMASVGSGSVAINRHIILVSGGTHGYVTVDYGTTFKLIYDGTTNPFHRSKFGRGQFVFFNSNSGSTSRAGLRCSLT